MRVITHRDARDVNRAKPLAHAARISRAFTAFTPSTTHGGHPGWRGAPVATTDGFLGAVAAQCDIHCRGHVYGSSAAYWNAGSRMYWLMRGILDGPSKKLLSCRATNSALATHAAP